MALAGNYFGLRPEFDSSVEPSASLPVSGAVIALGCYERPGQTPLWALFGGAAPGVRINGRSLLAGIGVLRDRDEILIAGRARFYFSTEEFARVEPFPGGDGPVFCARCRQSIASGTPAVRCPACGHWCEQSDDKPCWTYAATCPMCEQPTAFETGLRWTPEEL